MALPVAAPEAHEDPHASGARERHDDEAPVSLDVGGDLFPAVACPIADADEDAAPQEGAGIRGARKVAVADRGGPGGDGSQMADTGNEIAKGEKPVTEPGEPSLRAQKCLLVHLEQAMQSRRPGCASEHVAERDASRAPGYRRDQRGRSTELPAPDERARERHEQLVRD